MMYGPKANLPEGRTAFEKCRYYKFIWSIFYFEYAIVNFLAPL